MTNIIIRRFIPSEISKYLSSDIVRACGTGTNADGNIYCFYGLFLNNDEMIGFVKYEVYEKVPIISLERIEINPLFRRMGYGRELLSKSLEDLVAIFDYICSVRVLSSSSAIEFYKYNGFVAHLENDSSFAKLSRNILIKHLK